METFGVRYGSLFKGVTATATLALLGVAAMGAVRAPAGPASLLASVVLPLALLAFAALYTVRRYEIDADGLHVVQPVGRRCIARTVSAVVADDDALKWAMRAFGNGGLFSITGRYGTRRYGSCRVWATERANLVVLRGDRGSVIVSPRERDAFVAAVKARFGVRA